MDGGAASTRGGRRRPEGDRLLGQMHGLVALDAADNVLRPAILWNDQRTAAECAEIEEAVGLERLVSLTGNRALTGFTAPKLLWLRAHELASTPRSRASSCRRTTSAAPDRRARDRRRRRVGDAALRRRAPALEPRGLRCARHPDRVAPPAHESPEIAGAGDQAAGALGVGIAAPGPVSVVLGTSGVVFAALDSFAADPQARAHVFCHAVPGTWHAMGVMLSAAGSLRWLRRHRRRRLRGTDRGGGGHSRRRRTACSSLPI